jgi:hypothetical protein
VTRQKKVYVGPRQAAAPAVAANAAQMSYGLRQSRLGIKEQMADPLLAMVSESNSRQLVFP